MFEGLEYVAKGGGCFLAGTKISTPEGTKAIQKLRPGDTIMSFNEKRLVDEYSGAASVQVLKSPGYYVINDSIKVTGTHPMYTSLTRWKDKCELEVTEVKYLLIGDYLVTDAGTQEIRKIEYFDKDVTVYNLINVVPNHNYYANNYLVHNKGGGGRGGGARSSSTGKSGSSTKPAAPKVGTSTAKPGSKIKTADGKQVQSSSKAPTNKNYTNSSGIVGDNGYKPKFTNGYVAPPGSVVYYPQHNFIDYLPWIYLFSQNSPSQDKTVIVQPDNKEVQAQPVQEGVDGPAVFNWILLIAIFIAIIGGVVWGVNKLTTRSKSVYGSY